MESTEIAVIELPEQVRVLAQNSGLPAEESKALAIGFNVFFTDLEALKLRIETEINLDDPGPEDEKKAGEFRKLLKKQRTTANQYRELANEKVQAVQRLNNGIFKLVEDNTKPLEDHLSKIENAARIKEEARLTKLEADRKEALAPFELDTTFYDLKNMPDEKWEAFYFSQKTAYEAVKAQKEQQEEENELREARMQIINDHKHYEYPNVDYGKISDNEFGAIIKDLDDAKAEQGRKLNLHNEREAALREYGYTDESTFLGNMTDEAYQVLLSEWQEKKRIADQMEEDRIKLENSQRDERIRLKVLSELGVHYPSLNEFGDESQPLGELSDDEFEIIKDALVQAKNRAILVTERRLELSKLAVFMSEAEIDKLDDAQYSTLYVDSLAAFELAEQEKEEKEEIERLQQARLVEVTPYISYGQQLDLTNLWVFTPEKWAEIMGDKKSKHQIAIDENIKFIENVHNDRKAILDSYYFRNDTLIDKGLASLSESEWEGVLLQAKHEFEEKQSQAPDKDKLAKYCLAISGIDRPECTSEKGKKAVEYIETKLAELVANISKLSAKM